MQDVVVAVVVHDDAAERGLFKRKKAQDMSKSAAQGC